MSQHSPANQRVDIQALRALAVLSVVLFHLNAKWVPGGFVGVDIFFVISGYLITGQLWRQVERDGKVNFKDFWARRARRLLPASLLVIFATVVTAFFVMPQEQLSKFVGDAIGATFYVANWQLIAKSTNYLEDTASPSPFQHFWSLSVEEQYYIIWPLVLFACLLIYRLVHHKPRTTVVAVLSLISVAGFAYSVLLTTVNPAAAYFSTFTRSWEFALGAVLSLALTRWQAKHLTPWAYWIGLALIIYSLTTFNSTTPFPSFWAALPVVGTALMLAVGSRASKVIPTKLLALKPVQFVGDISYSLYLWHWPVLVLAPWVIAGNLTTVRALVLLAIAAALAWLSKQFVEDPIRFGRLSKFKPLNQIAITTALMLVVSGASIGLAEISKATTPNRPNSDFVYQPDMPPGNEKRISCFTSKTSSKFKTCVLQAGNEKASVAVIGDSHTRQYNFVLQELAIKHGWQLTMISKSACPIQDAATYSVTTTDPSCREWNQKLDSYLAGHKFDLIFNSNASFYTQGNKQVSASYRKFVARQTERGTAWVLIKDNPKPMKDIMACLFAAKSNAAEACAVSREQALTPIDDLPNAVKGLAKVSVVDGTDKLCGEVCSPVIGNKLMYRDFSHISWRASQLIEPLIEQAVPAKLKN